MKTGCIQTLFPNGLHKCLTLSYDDCVLQDIRMIEILNQYGIKSTFNLNSGSFGHEDYLPLGGANDSRVNHSHVKAEQVSELYKNHEVAIHTVNHPLLTVLPDDRVRYECLEDKLQLEALVGYPVRGMAYPGGPYNEKIMSILKEIGICYARPISSHHTFSLPTNYLCWQPTCQHTDERLFELADKLLNDNNIYELKIFYLWGHSYEFDIYNNWQLIEDFCCKMSRKVDIWYATNIEIYDYLLAASRLEYSVDGSIVYNPTAFDVWLLVNNNPVCVTAGKVSKLI